jgi:hypothetical protein
MPAKGQKLGYVKHPETGEYVDPRTLPSPPEPKKEPKISIEIVEPKKDEPPPLTILKEEKPYAKVMIIWRDHRGREKATSYTMSSLSLHEDVDESYTETGKKQIHLSISVAGDVIEKN